MSHLKFAVNEPFPAPAPQQEGAVMELWKSGLVVLIQFPGLTADERKAFKKSFRHYAYLETDTPVPVAVWTFMFSQPLNPIDVNFDATRVNPDVIEWYLDNSEGVKNLITFYLLDGQILRGMKGVGLELDAVQRFQATIKKQLAAGYSQSDYEKYLAAAYQYGTDELYQMGVKYKK
jgi:hypothetical protein